MASQLDLPGLVPILFVVWVITFVIAMLRARSIDASAAHWAIYVAWSWVSTGSALTLFVIGNEAQSRNLIAFSSLVLILAGAIVPMIAIDRMIDSRYAKVNNKNGGT